MSPERRWFVVKSTVQDEQHSNRIEDAIGLLQGIEGVTRVEGERPLIAEPGTTPTLTSAQFLQAWHNLSPNQKVRIFPELKRNLLTGEQDLSKKEFVSVHEAALLLTFSPQWVRTLLKEGHLPSTRDERGHHRIAYLDVINLQRKPGGRPPRNQ